MNLHQTQLQSLITPLRLIFWGGLLCVLDFSFSQTTNGSGFSFDILNDLVGMLMITWAVHRLSRFSNRERYAKQMMFVLIAALLGCFNTLHAHFIYNTPTAMVFLTTLIGLLGLVAMVVFCMAMRGLCQELKLTQSQASWQVTMLLFVLIYLLPLGVFYLATLGTIATQSSFNIDLGPTGLLLIPVFLVPIIHLFISTSRMKNEAEQSAAA